LDFLAYIQEHTSWLLEQFFLGITILTDFRYLLGIMLVIFWCINKNWAYRIGFSVLTASFLNGVLKMGFQEQRPWNRIHDPMIERAYPTLDAATGYSFPSGHAMSFTAFFLPMFRISKRLLFKILPIVAIALVALSRIYLRVHTPLDVLTGVVLAIIIFLIVDAAYLYIERTSRFHLVLWALVPIAVGCIAALLFFRGAANDESAISGIKDCIKSAGSIAGFCISYFVERKYIGFRESATLPMQLVKCGVGAVGLVAIMYGLKFVFPDQLLFDFIRYMLTSLWAIMVMPYLIKRYMNKITKAKA